MIMELILLKDLQMLIEIDQRQPKNEQLGKEELSKLFLKDTIKKEVLNYV